MFPASWSVVDAVPTVDPEALFSATERFEKVMSLGASLTFVTVIVNFFGNWLPWLSVTWMRIASDDLSSKSNGCLVLS